ncbi:hypothetical protein BO71DRAFT_403957 [Aspergillus ellipticus CBS 707.79]|uniref:Uncharacterized protein n=1 Tax=Aspergillus ellipticus CBS 707.79 TaxID=1448320 RepID=A0A319D1D7_9EURO|nr:hypothetical protein BO71DRAFT_403957 [Aspergillus ellipticus CBS 707.79]
MARPFQPYEPELHKLSSPSSDSPSSPFPRGETPLSFKTNVNRSKTKRWVEAKKYSYDGNDWGDDEYEEYDDEPPPLPQVPSLNQSTGDIPNMFTRDTTRPPLPSSMDRSRSLDHVATLNAAGADSRSRSVGRTATDPNSRTVPIVRPADIYQRMRAASATRRLSAGPDYFSLNPSGAGPPVSESVSQDIPSASRAPEQAAGAPDDRMLHQTQGSPERPSDIESTPKGSFPTPGSDPPAIQLPDVKRVSSFGPDLSFGSELNAQGEAEPEHQLQHNPSLGFRSVVHQAFDVPDTPSTTVESVGRSNSDSTSMISPIISQRNPSETKTPTIVEEPESITTPSDARGSLVFKPGHRRDISLPNTNNSPSRTPVVSSVEGAPPSAAGEMSTDTPPNLFSTSPKAAVQLPRAGKDLPAPLSVGTSHITSEPTITTGDGVPVVIPSLSTENSPQDFESDRLRKEIMRSLSRENTPSQELENPVDSQTESGQGSLIPSEYERYWSEEPLTSPPVASPEYSTPPITSPETPAALASASAPSRPKLGRRFSWESSSSGDPTPATGVQSPPGPMPGQFPATVPDENEARAAEPVPDYESAVEETTQREEPPPEKPRLSIIPPIPESNPIIPSIPDNRSIISDGHLPEVYNAEAVPDSHTDEAPPVAADRRASRVMFTTPTTSEPILLGFREILGMKTSEDRVHAFDENRAKFGTIDTGLNQWLALTVQAHPEHHDVVEKSMKQTPGEVKAPVLRGKLPKKLASLGNFASSSHPDVSPSGSGHARRPSAPLGAMMNKQQVEQRGKELLHTAGVLGGKAGEAAKGFFARGRSKLKGGNDKVDS